jgi:hypothetical protein
MRRRFLREVAAAGLPSGPGTPDPVTEAQAASLPEPAQRYLRFMKVIGRPRDWSFRLAFTGQFRPAADKPWLKCEAWQYNSALAVARIFHIRIRMAGLVPVLGRDTYFSGRGRMLVRLLDRFTLVDGTGEEYDIGELVTWLNDAVLWAPSMLLTPQVAWEPVDGGSFDIALTNSGRTVTARVFVDERGAPVDFSTTDRFCQDPQDPKRLMRARWTTPVSGWRELAGRPLPDGGQAVWHLAEGPLPYADFRVKPESVAFNVKPGE